MTFDGDSLDDLFQPTTPANPAAVAPVCRRHDWRVFAWSTVAECARCGKVRDDAKAKVGRNNRKRGGAEELTIARMLGGEKVGPLGLPWDVVVPGYLRLQVKKLARWPSVAACLGWLDAMPMGADMRGVTVTLAGRNGRRVLIVDLDEFAGFHGKEEAP